MKYLFIIPIALAAIILLALMFLKKNMPAEKLKQRLLIFGVICCIVAIGCLLMAFYISGDKTNLYKSCLPLTMLTMAIVQLKRK